jgi:hypothetical protein
LLLAFLNSMIYVLVSCDRTQRERENLMLVRLFSYFALLENFYGYPIFVIFHICVYNYARFGNMKFQSIHYWLSASLYLCTDSDAKCSTAILFFAYNNIEYSMLRFRDLTKI